MDNNKTREQILQALNWRYATQVFDTSKKISDDDLHTILESARLAPSSIGIEAWKFLVIQNPEVREKIFEVGKQPKMKDASHLVIIACRTDVAENITRERLERTAKIQNQKIEELAGLKATLERGISSKAENGALETWVRSQSYIPLGMMIETASLLGIDNGPMEGFPPDKVENILDLKAQNLKPVTMLALGYRGEDPISARPKVRRAFDDVVQFI